MHDSIRQQQLAAGAPKDVARALRQYGAESDEVLWAALFALAVLVREGGNPYRPATRAVAAAGTLRILQAALQEYKVDREPCTPLFATPTLKLPSTFHTLPLTLPLEHGRHWRVWDCDVQASAAAQEDGGDEMIITAGDYLIKTLEPAARRLRWESSFLLTAVSVPVIASALAYGWRWLPAA